MRSELLQEDKEALYAAIDAALPEERIKPLKKKAQDLAESIADDIEWNLKDNLASRLSYHVAGMAERVINALLDGNEAEMIRWLQCDKRGWTGRSDGYSTKAIEQQHPVIHGRLFEQGCVLLRKRIADAHSELIKNERILDLEDQVKSLVAQNNKLEHEKERAWERVREMS